jgi:hypothetical protein
LKLYNDAGAVVDDGTLMKYNEGKSSETMLVYTAEGPDRTLPEGWYTPFFELHERTLQQLQGDETLRQLPRVAEVAADPELLADEINFTFSAASDRPNVRLDARLVEDAADQDLGTVRRMEGHAIVEVQVLARSPVRRARVIGFWQKISKGTAMQPITPQFVEFHDTGPDGPVLRPARGERPEYRDRIKDDGIYTAAIPLAGFDEEGAEIRIFIQAESTDESRYRELEGLSLIASREEEDEAGGEAAARSTSFRTMRRQETIRAVAAAERALREQSRKDAEAAEGKAPRFTRATSLHFRVEP